MASIDEYLASRQCIWGEFIASGSAVTTVSEVRRFETSSPNYQTLTRLIPNETLSAWLSGKHNSQTAGSNPQHDEDTCILRIVWVPYDRKSGVIDLGQRVLEEATQAFHHQLAQSRFRATFAGVASVLEPSNGNRTYWFCNHPHLAVTWSRDPSSRIMNVIFIAQQRKIDLLQDLISCRFMQDLANFDLIPSLMCLILLCREIDCLLSDVKGRVRQAEVRTGHHCFTSRVEMPATGDLLQLSAAMSGCMSNLAVLSRRLGILEELKGWTVEGMAEMQKNSNHWFAGIASVLDTIRQHSTMQQFDVEFFKRRAQTQQDALLHLIAEHGTLASRGIAKDSRSLAMLARKDTATMKALAIMATLFIPPTFVSSLFSIPLFDWGAEDTPTPLGRRVLLYLSITGPLTLVTFAIWGLFHVWKRSRRNSKVDASRWARYPDDPARSEMIALVAKRRSET